MIYSETENPTCRICTHSTFTNSEVNVNCNIKGAVPADFCCRKFKYDIFKKGVRPKKKLLNHSFSKSDFEI